MMKKQLIALFCACCAFTAADAQERHAAVIDSTSMEVSEEIAPAKKPREFQGRKKYFNLGYAWEKLEAVDFAANAESEYAFFLTYGKTFYLHKKAIAGMVKFGLDFMWTDITYAKYKTDYLSVDLGEGVDISGERSVDMHRLDYSLHLGPSLTVNPVGGLCVNVYFRYAPTLAMSLTDNMGEKEIGVGYTSAFLGGGAISYKAISVGLEYRFGTTKMKGFVVDFDKLFDGDFYDDFANDYTGAEPPSMNDVLGNVVTPGEKIKYHLKDLRVYLSFRF